MGYRIRYEKEMIKRPMYSQMGKQTKSILCAAVSICAAILLLLASGGINKFKHWILPGNAEVTEAALNTLVADLKQGESLDSAFTAFCQEILDHANIPQ